MKLVINITKEEYESIKKNPHWHSLGELIANGIPLPKGHGRLIDADRLMKAKRMWYRLKNGDVACHKIDIENAPTIIEADKN